MRELTSITRASRNMAQGASDFSAEHLAAATVLSARAWLPSPRLHAAFGKAHRELGAHDDAVKGLQ